MEEPSSSGDKRSWSSSHCFLCLSTIPTPGKDGALDKSTKVLLQYLLKRRLPQSEGKEWKNSVFQDILELSKEQRCPLRFCEKCVGTAEEVAGLQVELEGIRGRILAKVEDLKEGIIVGNGNFSKVIQRVDEMLKKSEERKEEKRFAQVLTALQLLVFGEEVTDDDEDLDGTFDAVIKVEAILSEDEDMDSCLSEEEEEEQVEKEKGEEKHKQKDDFRGKESAGDDKEQRKSGLEIKDNSSSTKKSEEANFQDESQKTDPKSKPGKSPQDPLSIVGAADKGEDEPMSVEEEEDEDCDYLPEDMEKEGSDQESEESDNDTKDGDDDDAEDDNQGNDKEGSAEGQDEKPFFQCGKCNKSFSSKTWFEKHLKEEENGTELTCKLCEKTFTRMRNLNEHMTRRHSGLQKSFKCDLCDFTGKLRRDLTKHKTNMHINTSTHREERKKFACAHCPLKFPSISGLDTHLRTHTGERPFQCEACGKSFNTKRLLESHTDLIHTVDKSTKSFACDQCSFRTHLEKYLERHKWTHDPQKYSSCHFCGVHILSRNLRMHTPICPKNPDVPPERTRADEPLFPCDICGKKFKVKGFVDKHKAKQHPPGEKGKKSWKEKKVKKVCHKCGFTAIGQTALRNHLKKHVVGSSLTCPHCALECNDKRNLKTHLRWHEIKEEGSVQDGDKGKRTMYKCDKCQSGYRNKQAFEYHLKNACSHRTSTPMEGSNVIRKRKTAKKSASKEVETPALETK